MVSVKWVYRRSYAVTAGPEGTHRVGVLLDITARKQAEAALHANEALWKLALESAGDGVWDWNLVTGEEFFSAQHQEHVRLRRRLGHRKPVGRIRQPHASRRRGRRWWPTGRPISTVAFAAYRNEHRILLQGRKLEMGALARHADCA